MILDMEKVMATPGAREDLERLTATMEADAEVGPLMQSLHSIEDVYELVKHFAKAKFEVVKELFEDAVNYFKEDKVMLKDETLDNVVGGFSWSSLWNNKIVKYAAATVVVGACALIGLLSGMGVGSVVGGPVGSAIGGIAGLFAGCVAGIAMADEYILN